MLIDIVCAALATVSAAAIYGAGRMAEAGETLGAAVRGSQFGSQVSLLVEKQRGLVTGAAAELDLDRQAKLREAYSATHAAIEVLLARGPDATAASNLGGPAQFNRTPAAAAG